MASFRRRSSRVLWPVFSAAGTSGEECVSSCAAEERKRVGSSLRGGSFGHNCQVRETGGVKGAWLDFSSSSLFAGLLVPLMRCGPQ